ncbi:MAG: hypothetical protein GTO17_06540 [Candidatus Aminicenantes bacterium]|nr:hypothetical protein [Candidatus Aminicenantes bacterium]
MKFLSSLRTWLWLLSANLRKKTNKGALTLLAAFVFFVFTAIGLSLIYLSQLHLRISAFKKHCTLLEYSSENGIKQGFSQFLALVSQVPSPYVLSPEELNHLRENAQKGTILEEFLGLKQPLSISGDWENLKWESHTNWLLKNIIEKEVYFKAIHEVFFSSEGMIDNFELKRKTRLSASLHIIGGQIPLSFFPFLIDKKLKPEEKSNFSDKKRIAFSSPSQSQLGPKISFSGENLIPDRADAALAKALRMKLFKPQNLSTADLRIILGLEESEEPVPEGVYLIKDNSGLGGIYVQGNVEEMILAIEEEFQVISFQTQPGTWILKFSPSRGKTFFTSPSETFAYDLIPLGLIIINGKVKSLGGGVVDSSGEIILVKDEEVPSVLQGAQLSIISSDRITVSSHLILQGVKWQDGIPYAKDSDSRLAIFSTGKDFWDDTMNEGGIVVKASSPDKIQLQASLTAAGKGFVVEGEGKKVQILGSLQATDYSGGNNSLTLTLDERLQPENHFLENAPLTSKPVLFISYFKALEWEEF